MKKFGAILTVGMMSVGCASQSEFYHNQAQSQNQRQEQAVLQAVTQAPKWMAELPRSTSAVYANGTASSTEMSMALDKAKTVAYGKICMAAGGTVDQRSSVYRADFGETSTENSELAVRSACNRISITGVETVEVKTIMEGSRFRSYVLVALPTGSSNALQKRVDQIAAQERGAAQSQRVFSEMDQAAKKP